MFEHIKFLLTTWVSFLQLCSLASEQELYNIQKECAEKDAIIKELTAAAHTSNNADAKVSIMAMLVWCFADGISLQHFYLFASRESQSCRIFLKGKIW
jgi:hypothetical protein